MTKFIVLYHMPASTMANMPEMTPEQMQEGMKPWMAWAEKCGPALVDLGTPLSGGLAVTSTGSSASTKDVAGYSILEADSMDAAKALMEGHPHFGYGEGCSIEVHESMPLPGM